MRGIIITLLAVGLIIGGVGYARARGISLPTVHLPSNITVPKIAINPAPNASGSVLGAQSTLNISHFAESFSGAGNVLSKLVNTLGVQTIKTGETLVNNVSSTPSTQADVIDMSKVVQEVSSRVESIPGSLVNQAKIEYCKQVLIQATISATLK